MNAPAVGDSSFFDALVDAAADAIIIIDHQGCIQRFNRSAQSMFGYEEQEVLGQNVKMLMPEPHKSQHDTYLRRYRETGEAAIIGKGRDERGKRKSGEIFPMRLSVGESRNQGELHFVGIIHDTSQQLATEEKLRTLEQQLFHADRLLTLGELTAGIAHEINQPLTAIAAYADAARHLVEKATDTVDPAVHDICDRIAQQSRRAAAVVSRLRELVRSGTSKKINTDITSVINNTLLLFDYEINKYNISISVKTAESLPLVFIDEIQIQQILVNLVKNSIDALREQGQGGGQIEISVERSGKHVLIGVKDNGPGIDAAILPRLFEPFYTSKPKGVGLGLSICKNIASAHGGSLVCTTSRSGETRFTLRLPLLRIG